METLDKSPGYFDGDKAPGVPPQKTHLRRHTRPRRDDDGTAVTEMNSANPELSDEEASARRRLLREIVAHFSF